MCLSILPVASIEEIPVLNKIYLAFLRIPVNQAIWPDGITEAVLFSSEARSRKTFAAGIPARYLKVVDADLDEIVAFAIWYIFETPEAESRRTDLVPREWGPDTNLEIATKYWAGIVKSRRIMAGKPDCCEPSPLLAINFSRTKSSRLI
jgi:hypothetical protein